MNAPAFTGGIGSAQPGPRTRQTFHARTVIVPPQDREERIQSIARFLRAALPGKRLAVEITKYAPRRSNNLNAYYWGVVVKQISEATGYEPQEVHEILAMKFLPPRTIEMAGELHTIRSQTSKLSTPDFQQYLEEIKRWAAQELEGLYIPDPGEYT